MANNINLMFDEIKHETEKAWLIEFEEGVEEWMPMSQCELDSINGVEVISVPEWLATDKGLGTYAYE